MVVKAAKNLRATIARRLQVSELPLVVYAAMAVALIALAMIRNQAPDLSLNLISELLGAAFTLFIIDSLLVRSKAKRWGVVRSHIDYLIARSTNRLRDGIATRFFAFAPALKPGAADRENFASVRSQRDALFRELLAINDNALRERLNEAELFTERSYAYLNEKAEDVWDILNMKYSEYLAPELVSLLIRLHTNLKDTAANILQYRKAERFKADTDRAYYQSIGEQGIAASLRAVIEIVVELKHQGYSEPALLTVKGGAAEAVR